LTGKKKKGGGRSSYRLHVAEARGHKGGKKKSNRWPHCHSYARKKKKKSDWQVRVRGKNLGGRNTDPQSTDRGLLVIEGKKKKKKKKKSPIPKKTDAYETKKKKKEAEEKKNGRAKKLCWRWPKNCGEKTKKRKKRGNRASGGGKEKEKGRVPPPRPLERRSRGEVEKKKRNHLRSFPAVERKRKKELAGFSRAPRRSKKASKGKRKAGIILRGRGSWGERKGRATFDCDPPASEGPERRGPFGGRP